MTFEELLNRTNEEGNVYWCDCRTFFGEQLTYKQLDEIYNAINQIKRRLNETKHICKCN